MATRNYVDYDGLSAFLTKLKAKYAENSSTKYQVNYAATAGNAATATALATARTITLTGDASGSVSFDGSANQNLAVTIADASASSKGLMSTDHYSKLEGLANIKSVGDKLSISEAGQLSVDLSTYATKDDITAVFKFKGTVADKASLPTGAAVGDVYHVIDTHSEYVWVDANESDVTHPEAHWEELGVTVSLAGYATETYVNDALKAYRKTTDKIQIADIEGLDTHIQSVKVNAAVTADKVANALTVVGPGNNTEHTYDGSEALRVDLSSIATSEAVAAKADKLTAAASGHILVASADGNLADSGVASSVLKDGAVAKDNASFVTGGQVAGYVDPKISALESSAATYAFANGTNGQFTVTPSIGGTAQDAITVTTGADANKIEVVKVNNAALAIVAEDKSVNIDLSAYAKDEDFKAIPTTGDKSIESLFA